MKDIDVKKKMFKQWLGEASNDELKDYAFDKEFPARWKVIITGLLLAILCVLALYGTAFSIAFYMNSNAVAELNEDISKSFCVDHGGYIKTMYREEEVFIMCVDKNIHIPRT